jgi:hypothetical protein
MAVTDAMDVAVEGPEVLNHRDRPMSPPGVVSPEFAKQSFSV